MGKHDLMNEAELYNLYSEMNNIEHSRIAPTRKLSKTEEILKRLVE